ncbi:TonB-dependent receptor [Rhodocytophaga rosea]|uniref:TonB-dependent receptor n=1 Tax=Rhodocytophaga rosea TaxID=2704465 RepID=A0A6C0GHX4_9BACT|nr:TonB-dependent receptor [Rhodocytophaga rosea]QHT67636.1 TonB-dependent receptor [Rhodocytophaga rosea]
MNHLQITYADIGKMMRVTIAQITALLLFTTLSYAGDSQAQAVLDRDITLHVKKLSLAKVLTQIEKQADVKFVYSQEFIRVHEKITLDASNKKLSAVLDELLEPLQITYEVVSQQIVLRKKKEKKEAIQSIPIPSVTLNEAAFSVSGKVSTETGEGIPGVNVLLKSSATGTTSDVDGNYSLSVPDGNGTLVFSYIGYTTKEIPISNQNSINVTLLQDVTSLSEVVVVGYGTQRSEDVTGSVATIDQKVISNLPVSTIDQKIMGQVAGVQIQQLSGAPGSGTSVKIRGSGSLGAGNEPLYVVDGMPYSAGLNQNLNPLVFINPNDIESVTILKDASSTAIYGSRGANGVIMITTKKGNYDRTEVNVSSMMGVQQVPHKGRPNMLNQREFAELQRDKIGIVVRQRENRDATTEDYPVEYQNLDALTGEGTDWYDLLLQPAVIQDHNVSILKGTKESRLNFSLGYFKQEGTIKYTGLERFSSKLGMDLNIGRAIKVGASLQPTYIQQTRTNTNSDRADILGVSNWANPVMSPYDENGKLTPYIVSPQSKYHSAWSFANPLFVLRETTQSQKDFQNLGFAFIEWNIIPDLKFRSSLNTIWSTSKYTQFVPSTVGAPNRPPAAGTGRSANSRGESFDWLIENTLTYEKTLGSHRVNALVGYTTQKSTANIINLNADPYSNDLLQTINAAQAIKSWGQNVNQWSMVSYLGRVNYAFKDRYLFTATFRSDGSSRFGAQNRYALFPSVAAAWRVSEEAFLQNSTLINDLKLRVSYGKSGNNNIGNYAHLAAINAGSYVFGNTQVTASSVGLANPFLTWEQSNQIDAGVDVGVFNNRLTLAVDYYYRKSMNMLLNNVIPAITGFNSQTVNKGNVRNTGVEIALGATPVSGNFTWDLNMNVAFNRNKILSLNDNNDRILAGNNDNNPTHISVVGKPIGQFFGYIFEGLYTAEDMANPEIIKTPQVYEGNVRYRDINGDGIINDLLDYTIIGSPHPDFIFGITNSFSYKRFNLNVILNGQYGGQVMNGLRQTVDNLQGFFNVSQEWTNRWRSPDQPGDGRHYGVPKLTPSLGHRVSNLWVEDATFLRIANITLGYSLPDTWMERTRFIKNCRLYLTVQNLALFTRYGGANPEAQSASVSNTLAPGFDISSYPLARTSSIGLNLTF